MGEAIAWLRLGGWIFHHLRSDSGKRLCPYQMSYEGRPQCTYPTHPTASKPFIV